MSSYPEPHHHALVFHRKRPVMQTDPSGPKPSQLLEVQGRVLRVLSQQSVGLVSQAPYIVRKLPITRPKPRIGAVPHRSVQRPARRSSRASAASASRCPAATSSSIWRSQAAASNSANHALNASSSVGVSRRTASSISFTLLMALSLLYTAGSRQLARPPATPLTLQGARRLGERSFSRHRPFKNLPAPRGKSWRERSGGAGLRGQH